jgi:ATP-dependent RNA helicase HelY
VLEELGFVVHWSLTAKGETLARVYNEADLLIVEALEHRLFDGLDAPGLAAVLSALIYEPRGPDQELFAGMPNAATQRVWRALTELHDDVRAKEESLGLDLTREPNAGFAERAHLWASGAPLDEILGPDTAAGDFVRTTKQVIDLLRQLEEVTAGTPLAAIVAESVRRLHRGVVAYSSFEV